MPRRVRKKSLISKYFFVIAFLALVLGTGIFYYSGKKTQEDSSCGCGVVTEETNGEYEDTHETAVFNNLPVMTDYAWIRNLVAQSDSNRAQVLGANADEKWVEVDLSEQKVYAHNGNNLDYQFLVSTGKWAPTPTGDFRIWAKLKFTKMSGGRKENNTYYYLPNVPYTQYFYKGYGLHGAYWHNNFGHPMSHGCVNMSIPDADKLFSWTNPQVPSGKNTVYTNKDNVGTRVIVHD